MTAKLDFYDVLGILVPGFLLLLMQPLLFPSLALQYRYASYPDGFMVMALTAVAIFVGHLVQTLGSLLEPLFNASWGGRPSGIALENGLSGRYLPTDTADRIRAKLTVCVGSGATVRSLFLYAMQQAEGSDRTSRFNSLYAYHRGLLALWLVCCASLTASLVWGGLAGCSWSCKTLLMVGAGTLLLLLWYRAKQRAMYYVREVLLTAERMLNDRGRENQKTDQPQKAKG